MDVINVSPPMYTAGRAEQDTILVQGAVHAVIMQNRLRHAEEKVHNGEVQPRETFLSDPEAFKRMEEAARYAIPPAVQAKHVHKHDRKEDQNKLCRRQALAMSCETNRAFRKQGCCLGLLSQASEEVLR
jgi:hypothetical protein